MGTWGDGGGLAIYLFNSGWKVHHAFRFICLLIAGACFIFDLIPLLFLPAQLKLLMWQERPLINVSQTQLLLNKLQELSMARLRPDFVEADLPSDALSSVRLALATNLGRAILEEWLCYPSFLAWEVTSCIFPTCLKCYISPLVPL